MEIGSKVITTCDIIYDVTGRTPMKIPRGSNAILLDPQIPALYANGEVGICLIQVLATAAQSEILVLTPLKNIELCPDNHGVSETQDEWQQSLRKTEELRLNYLRALLESDSSKFCLACNRSFDGKISHCPGDGTLLIPVPGVHPGHSKNEIIKSSDNQKWQLQELLSDGYLKSVFSAKRLSDGLEVVLKILQYRHRDSNKAKRKIQKENSFAKNIEHPAAAKLLASGIHNELPFIVLERAYGKSIKELRNSISSKRTLEAAITVCDFLEYLQSKQLCLPKLESADLYLSEQSGVPIKLVGFGPVEIIGHPNGTYSVNGILNGDFSCFAPEVLMGKPVNIEANIYSLASIVAGSLSRKEIFKGSGMAQAIQILYDEPAEFKSLNPELKLPKSLEFLLKRCLSKKASERPSLAECKSEFSAARSKVSS
ncbi:MAG: protein kinase [Candidatus Obscuribacterales bacterium]|nr:protein kinase [Candidatus Obscuribacterales bacterium]